MHIHSSLAKSSLPATYNEACCFDLSLNLGKKRSENRKKSSNKQMTQQLDETFLKELDELKHDFGKLHVNLMNGRELEIVVQKFYLKYKEFLESFEAPIKFVTSDGKNVTKFSRFISHQDTKKPSVIELVREEAKIFEQDPSIKLDPNANYYADAVAQVYWRLACATYLRQALEMSESGKMDDFNRNEPLEFARVALRMSLQNFDVAYWYMVAIGYYVEKVGSLKERAICGNNFRLSSEHCVKLNPNHYLPYNMLGRYYTGLGALNWAEKKLATTFINIKLDGGYEEAEENLLKSHEKRNDYTSNGLCLVKLYLAWDEKKYKNHIKKWMKFGLEQACQEPITIMDRNELILIKSKLKLDD